MDWKHQVILTKLAEGYTYPESATAAGLSRQGLWKRVNASLEFRHAVVVARETGEEEEKFRIWLRHPFKGLRPPTGKGHGGNPQFAYGRR